MKKASRINSSKDGENHETEKMATLFKQLTEENKKFTKNYLKITQKNLKLLAVCKVCGKFKTANPDGICDRCKIRKECL